MRTGWSGAGFDRSLHVPTVQMRTAWTRRTSRPDGPSTTVSSTIVLGMKRLRLPEFIEVLVPTRDRNRRALGAQRQREWRERLARYLLQTLRVTGFQESKREGVWKQEQKDLREYDPKADRLYLVREKVHVMRTSCTRAQVDAFRKGGETLLAEMGRALNQEAVAYETREGLTILTL